jgi:hypothetical protein
MVAALILQTVISFTTIASGPTSGIEDSRQVVIETPIEWQALWNAHKPGAAVPEVDFTKSAVVAVFLGTRPTAGFSVKITGIKRDGNRAVVEYTESKPRADLMVAQMLTSPFHMVRVPKDIGTVVFQKQ